jgi:hypothetical protein
MGFGRAFSVTIVTQSRYGRKDKDGPGPKKKIQRESAWPEDDISCSIFVIDLD